MVVRARKCLKASEREKDAVCAFGIESLNDPTMWYSTEVKPVNREKVRFESDLAKIKEELDLGITKVNVAASIKIFLIRKKRSEGILCGSGRCYKSEERTS